MDFPTYVPAAVRTYLTTTINGGGGMQGYAAYLANDDSQLEDMDREIATMIQRGEVEGLEEYRRDRAEVAESRNAQADEIDCLWRLGSDPRMQDAYALLTREFNDDRQWHNFIFSACGARQDCSKYRDGQKRADELRVEIADAAKRLAKLIRLVAETRMEMPAEFFSILELLRKTGDPTLEISAPPTAQKRIAVMYACLGGRVEILPREEQQNTLCDALEEAPHLPELLDTLADAARNFNPKHHGMIAAALASRQRNPKIEYLRAFGFLVTVVHRSPNYQIALTTPVIKAMAITANVAMNLPKVDVSYDDARKALSKLNELLVNEVHPFCCSVLPEEWLENSGEK